MRALRRAVAVVGIVAMAAQVGFTQARPAATPSIEGVWRGTSIVTTSANARTDPTRQPNIFIYTRGYFSQVRQDGDVTPEPPRSVLAAPKNPTRLTDAEKLALYEHWRPVAAEAGRYEIKGTTLYQYALVSKTQSAEIIEFTRTGHTAQFAPTAELKFEGNNTMVQISKSADGKSETRRTYTRLESAADVEARPPAAPSIAGVWLGTSYVATGAVAFANPKRQPNIFVYTKGYYSTVRQDSDTTPPLLSRRVLAPPKNPNKLSGAEKLARYEHWAPVSADSGRYEVKGTAFYQYPLVSKNQSAAVVSRNQTGNMGTSAPNSEIKFEGSNMMVQIAKSADGKTETRRTYTRLE